jgi:hypothetical protein
VGINTMEQRKGLNANQQTVVMNELPIWGISSSKYQHTSTSARYWVLVFRFLHGVRDKFSDDVSGLTAAPETPSENSPRTPYKNPKTKNQYSFHGESLKSSVR